jgi:hypothetical protein
MSQTEGKQILESCQMRQLALGQLKECYASVSGLAGLPAKAARSFLLGGTKGSSAAPVRDSG